MNLKKSIPFLLSGLFMLTIASCKKDNNDLLVKPELTGQTGSKAIDTVTVGNTLLIHPKISNSKDAVYAWTVNGVSAKSDSVLSFQPTVKGDYKINFKAYTKGGNVSVDYNIHTYAKYENGFYIINEGWFGHGTGTVSFYRYDTQKLEDSLFVKENPSKNLNPATSTLQSGVIFNNKLFLVSKVGGPMVVTDENTLKEEGRIPAQGGNDWRSFVGVDATKGILSAQTGLYTLDLNTYQIGRVANITGQIGDVIKEGNYIFALSATEGVVILNAADNSIVKKIAGALVGFTRTIDGAIWAGGGTKLFKISPSSLDVETITVPFTIFGSWGAWHPGSIAASTKENAVYFVKNGSFSGGTDIYKYIPGNAASLTAPFITLPTGKIVYGAGISFVDKLNRLAVTTVQSGFGTNFAVNNLYFYDPATAAITKTVSYSGYYFPSVIVQHK